MKTKTGSALLIILLVFIIIININFFSSSSGSLWGSVIKNIYNELQQSSIALIYLLTAIFLHLENERLQDFYLDRLGLVLFIGSGLFVWAQLKPIYYFVVLFSIAWVLYTTINKWSLIKRLETVWLYTSILYTLLALIPATIIALALAKTSPIGIDNKVPSVFIIFVINIWSIAPKEEILFRCLLWGYLNKIGMQPKHSFVIQFFLFWLLHYEGKSSGVSFFISLPISIFIHSMLAYKSKQITPSILSHALYNTFVLILWRMFI